MQIYYNVISELHGADWTNIPKTQVFFISELLGWTTRLLWHSYIGLGYWGKSNKQCHTNCCKIQASKKCWDVGVIASLSLKHKQHSAVLDKLEEQRPHFMQENNFRNILKKHIIKLLQCKKEYWSDIQSGGQGLGMRAQFFLCCCYWTLNDLGVSTLLSFVLESLGSFFTYINIIYHSRGFPWCTLVKKIISKSECHRLC
jgi:hypothetical protein